MARPTEGQIVEGMMFVERFLSENGLETDELQIRSDATKMLLNSGDDFSDWRAFLSDYYGFPLDQDEDEERSNGPKWGRR